MSKKLPQGWKEYKIPEVLWFQEGPGVRKHQYTEKGIKLLNVTNISDNKLVLDKTNIYLDKSEFEGRYNHFLVDEGDLIIASSGIKSDYFGKKIAFAEKEHLPLCMNTSTIRFKVLDKKIINLKYIYYFFKTYSMRMQLEFFMTGSAQLNFGPSHLKQMKIIVPPLEEQERIVSILERAEDAICKREESNRLLDELIQSKFIDIFGNPTTNSKEWELGELSNVLINIENGKSFVCENYNREGSYPAILKLSAVTYGIYNSFENKALIDQESFVSSVEVKNGDLLFTRKNTPELVGMSAYVYDTTPNLMMPDLVFRLNTNEKCNKIYLWQLINHKLFRGKIKALSNGSAKSMSNISKQNLMKLEIPIPPIEIQDEFSNFVNQVNKLKFEMGKSLEELENNFNSLMQRAFNGEL